MIFLQFMLLHCLVKCCVCVSEPSVCPTWIASIMALLDACWSTLWVANLLLCFICLCFLQSGTVQCMHICIVVHSGMVVAALPFINRKNGSQKMGHLVYGKGSWHFQYLCGCIFSIIIFPTRHSMYTSSPHGCVKICVKLWGFCMVYPWLLISLLYMCLPRGKQMSWRSYRPPACFPSFLMVGMGSTTCSLSLHVALHSDIALHMLYL